MSPFPAYFSSFAFANPLSNLRSYLPSSNDLSNLGENLQNKLLTYALKQGLSHFVLGFDQGSSRYDELLVADGQVELASLQLKANALDSLLPADSPFTVESGSISSVRLQVPRLYSISTYWTSSDSSSKVVVDVDHAEITLRIRPSAPPGAPPAADQSPDSLAASILHVAQTFADQQDEAQADNVSGEEDPFSYSYTEDAAPGAFPGGAITGPESVSTRAAVVAAFIQALLSRLDVSVSRVTINLAWKDPNAAGLDRQIQLRIEDSVYRNVALVNTSRSFQIERLSLYISAGTQTLSPSSSVGTLGRRSRSRSASGSASSISISGASLGLAADPRRGSADDDSDSLSSIDGADLLAMSMAVTDLRARDQSQREDVSDQESAFDGGQSLYESAVDAEESGPHPTSSPRSVDWTHVASFDGRAIDVRADQATSTIDIGVTVGLLRAELCPRDAISCWSLVDRCLAGRARGQESPKPLEAPARTFASISSPGCDLILHQDDRPTRVFAAQTPLSSKVSPHHRLCIQRVRYREEFKGESPQSVLSSDSITVLGFTIEDGQPVYRPLFALRDKFEIGSAPLEANDEHVLKWPLPRLTPNQPGLEVTTSLASKRIHARSLDCQIDLSAIDNLLATVNRCRARVQQMDRSPRSSSPIGGNADHTPAISWQLQLDDWRIRCCTRLGNLRKTPVSRPPTPFPLLLHLQRIVLSSSGDEARNRSRGAHHWTLACQAVSASLQTSVEHDVIDAPFLRIASMGDAAANPCLKAQLRSGLASQALIRMQAVSVHLDQRTSHCLQYAADDLTRYLDNIGGTSKTSPRDDIRMVGSRFFGPTASDNTWLEAASHERGLRYSAMLDLAIEQVKLDVESEEQDRLSLTADALTVKLKQATSFLEVNGSLFHTEIFSATRGGQPISLVPRGDASRGPILDFRLLAGSHSESEAKETNVDIAINGALFRTDLKHEAVLRAAQILKPPAGVFENIVPSDVVRTTITLRKCSTLYAPSSGQALLAKVSTCQYRTINTDDGDDTSFVLSLSKAVIHAVDALASTGELEARLSADDVPPNFARVGDVHVLDVRGRRRGSSGSLAIEVLRSNIACHLCSDSFETLCNIVAGFSRSAEPQAKPAQKFKQPVRSPSGQSLLGSVDDIAFSRPKGLTNTVDLRAYDLPAPVDDSAGLATYERSSFDLTDEVNVTRLCERTFALHRDYFTELLERKRDFHQPRPKFSLTVSDSTFTLSLHSGYDWTATREAARRRIRQLRVKLQRIRQLVAEGQSAKVEDLQDLRTETDWLNNSVYIAFPKSSDRESDSMSALADDLDDLDDDTEIWGEVRQQHTVDKGSSATVKASPSLHRSARAQVDLVLSGVEFRHETFDRALGMTSSTRMRTATIEVLDHLRTSTWNKFLTGWPVTPDMALIETGSSMLSASLETFGVQGAHSAESRLQVRICPLRFYVDQDTLGFLTSFSSSRSQADDGDDRATARAQTFFQHVEIAPVRLKLDYKPKRVDVQGLRQGRIMQLINFFHFEASEMVFRHVILRGVSGWSTLYYRLNEVWAPDVRANQMSDILSGITPIRSLVNVGTGVVDLVLLPVDQYRKEGKWQRGAKLGAKSFAQTAAIEAINLGGKLATGTQVVLEKAESVLGGRIGSDLTAEAVDDERSTSRYADQPANLRKGLAVARERLTSNMRSAAQTILAVPMEMYEPSDEHGHRTSLKPVVRAVPVAVLQGMIGVTDASRNALFGLRNQLEPHLQLETAQKYKSAP